VEGRRERDAVGVIRLHNSGDSAYIFAVGSRRPALFEDPFLARI